MPLTSPHGGNVYDFASRGLLDFSSNINPAGPPEYALEAARDALGRVNRYPDTEQREIKDAFSGWLGIPPSCLVFGNGASEMIRAVMAALRPSRVVVTLPTFSGYEENAASSGIPVLGIPSAAGEGFAFDINGVKNVLSSGDMLVICQPNNPTGVSWTLGELSELAGLCASLGGFLMADECFINLSRPKSPSCAEFIGEKNVVVLRAVTKDFAAPGLRVGFTVSHPDTARAVRRNLQPWPLNNVGEAFAIACARRPEPYLSDSAGKIAVSREALSRGIAGLGFEPNPSDANFLLVRSGSKGADEIHDFLLKRSILIRKCANFKTLDGRYFRTAVKSEGDNSALLSGLASIASG
jgi:threonine-phosphate decarboxylase